jgi:RNA polymerase sigma factor (TIGR02999 family)
MWFPLCLGFVCYICAVFGPAGHTNVFLSGKAEIAVETRQVFSSRSMRLQKLFACVSIRRIEKGDMTTPPSSQQEVTRLLGAWSGGDKSALERLIPLVQPELHRLAHHYMSREPIGHTLQTTALLNEAYLQLVDDPKRNWQNRTHFVAAAAQLMRRIMVDHARERRALKRGGGAVKVELDDAALVTERRSEELLALDEALEKLAALDPR